MAISWRVLTLLTTIFLSSHAGGAQTPSSGLLEVAIPTKNRIQPVLTMMMKMPSSGRAKGVLAFCTWSGEVTEIRARMMGKMWEGHKNNPNLVRLYNNLMEFGEKNDLAVISWTVATVWNNTKDYDELTADERAREDQNVDQIATAWCAGAAKLLSEQNIPMKNILIYGVSRGGQFAHRLVLRRSQFFSAIAIHINSTYEKPVQAAKSVAWLVSTGEFEEGVMRSEEFYHEALALNFPIIYKVYPDKAHDELPEADELRNVFFRYILSQPASTTGLNFQKSPYVGDFATNQYVDAAKQDSIEPAYRVYLPTLEIAKAWVINPASTSNW